MVVSCPIVHLKPDLGEFHVPVDKGRAECVDDCSYVGYRKTSRMVP